MRLVLPLLVCVIVSSCPVAQAQQYNSDNYLSKPHGVATLILTAGQRNSIIMNTFSLIPRWEFTAAAFIYNPDNDVKTDDSYSTTFYLKYMIHENMAKTGGLAVKAGTGLEPGYLENGVGLKDAFKTYWMNAPVTLPLFDNKVSWDLMPGTSVTFDYGEQDKTAPAFTYSTRLAWYPLNMQDAIVGEIYGAEGETSSPVEYRIGLRWEPSQHAVFALTYDQEFSSSNGAGVEFGIMLFSPPFIGFGLPSQ
jgi:hypothetical protein